MFVELFMICSFRFFSRNINEKFSQKWTHRTEGDKFISSPVDLDIEQFDPNNIIVPQLRNDPHVSWKLMSVICHRGPIVDSGHYWTWRRCDKDDRNNKFMKMNDEDGARLAKHSATSKTHTFCSVNATNNYY